MTKSSSESAERVSGVVASPSIRAAPARPHAKPTGNVAEIGWTQFAAAAVSMLGLVVGLHALCLRFYPKAELDPWNLSDFYPLSVFKFRLPRLYQLGLAIGLWAAFHWLWARLATPKARLLPLFGASLLLSFLSNLLHGWRYGLDYPTAATGTGSFEYYHDAILLKGPLWFLARFNAIQFELLEHARTHPPGPVLLYYVLHHSLRDPGLISVAVGALSLALALPYLRRLLLLLLGAEPPGALLLFAVLPAVLVYGIAVVDVFVASLFLAALVEFLDEARPRSRFLAALFLALSLFFSFGALFLAPVLLGFELLRRRRVTRALQVIGGALLLLALQDPLFGFDWLSAFLRASAIENEKGFLLLADPRRYLWYRLGSVAEVLVYFTPFLCLLWWRGVGPLRRQHPDGFALAWLGPAVLGLMLLAGMLKIGEAARVCVFILPYLLLPVLEAFRGQDERTRRRTVHGVFAWGLAFQLFGFYQW